MPKCVVFSERAFTSILVETQEKIRTETGGVFLGYRKGDVWYVIESIDPGPNSVFQPAYFEYDQDYINHLINKVSRLYSLQLDLIGLWHRHPGSYDSFHCRHHRIFSLFCQDHYHQCLNQTSKHADWHALLLSFLSSSTNNP